VYFLDTFSVDEVIPVLPLYFVYDTFTGINGTPIISHVGESGVTWTEDLGARHMIADGALMSITRSGSHVSLIPSAGVSGDWYFETEIYIHDFNNNDFIQGYQHSDNSFLFYISGDNINGIYFGDSGSFIPTFSIGQSYVIRFEFIGSAVQLLIDNVPSGTSVFSFLPTGVISFDLWGSYPAAVGNPVIISPDVDQEYDPYYSIRMEYVKMAPLVAGPARYTVLLRDDFTGSGTLSGRTPDGVHSGVWVEDNFYLGSSPGDLALYSAVTGGRLKTSSSSTFFDSRIPLSGSPSDAYIETQLLGDGDGGSPGYGTNFWCIGLRKPAEGVRYGIFLDFKRSALNSVYLNLATHDSPHISGTNSGVFTVANGADFKVRLEVQGLNVRVYLDGGLVLHGAFTVSVPGGDAYVEGNYSIGGMAYTEAGKINF
jgi:hypothetical protein